GGVDNRHRDQVVGGEDARYLRRGCVVLHGLQLEVEQRAQAFVRRVPQHPLEVHHAEEPAGRRLVRRQCHAHGGTQGGRGLVTADQREPLGHGGVRGHDDRVGGHQATGGVRLVEQQHPHVFSLFGLHQLEQGLPALVGELGDQVGGVVRLHLVEHVGGAVVF